MATVVKAALMVAVVKAVLWHLVCVVEALAALGVTGIVVLVMAAAVALVGIQVMAALAAWDRAVMAPVMVPQVLAEPEAVVTHAQVGVE
jgi:hypothetical protein